MNGLDCNAWRRRRRWRERLADAFIGACWVLAVVGWVVAIPAAILVLAP